MKRAILKNKTNFKEYMQFKNALNDTVHEYNDIKQITAGETPEKRPKKGYYTTQKFYSRYKDKYKNALTEAKQKRKESYRKAGRQVPQALLDARILTRQEREERNLPYRNPATGQPYRRRDIQ